MIYTSVIIRDFWTVTFEHTDPRFPARASLRWRHSAYLISDQLRSLITALVCIRFVWRDPFTFGGQWEYTIRLGDCKTTCPWCSVYCLLYLRRYIIVNVSIYTFWSVCKCSAKMNLNIVVALFINNTLYHGNIRIVVKHFIFYVTFMLKRAHNLMFSD